MSAMRVVGQGLWSRRHWGWPLLAVSAPLALFDYQRPESLDWAIFTACFNALAWIFVQAGLRRMVPVTCFCLAVVGMLHVMAMAPRSHMQNRGKERVFTDGVVQRLKQSNLNPQL